MSTPGIVISAPSSGAGKTTITLGIIRALSDQGLKVSAGKVGPDYIDTKFHERASGTACINLDSWAMDKSQLHFLAYETCYQSDILIIEGVMGLFDGALKPGLSGNGSTASIAQELGLPVILVIDATSQAQSVAALATGFKNFQSNVNLSGVILNNVSSSRHAALLTDALAEIDINVFGRIPRLKDLKIPSRHLGLVQADEHAELDDFIKTAAEVVSDNIDIPKLQASACSKFEVTSCIPTFLKPLGQNIAIANDLAFKFTYSHILESWRKSGVEISFFSPLNNETAASNADAIYLPGGYPELHAESLSQNTAFLDSLRTAYKNGKWVYGECGGFMVLGKAITDVSGRKYPMAGLLGLETTFVKPTLSLGYRVGTLLESCPFGSVDTRFRCHEFHYTNITEETGRKLFKIEDSAGFQSGVHGLINGSVFGSFLHVI